MFVIIMPNTEKLLSSYVFPSYELANSYARKNFFKGVYKVWKMIDYEEIHNDECDATESDIY